MQEAKDIQLRELKDMIQQLNTTVTALTGTIQEKDTAIARLTEEVSYLRTESFTARPLKNVRTSTQTSSACLMKKRGWISR